MAVQAFTYDFTIKELVYFVFKKKKCPKCGNRMEKSKCYEIVDGSIFDTNSVPLYIQGSQVKRFFYSFTCQKCGAEFTLSELSKCERRSK